MIIIVRSTSRNKYQFNCYHFFFVKTCDARGIASVFKTLKKQTNKTSAAKQIFYAESKSCLVPSISIKKVMKTKYETGRFYDFLCVLAKHLFLDSCAQ